MNEADAQHGAEAHRTVKLWAKDVDESSALLSRFSKLAPYKNGRCQTDLRAGVMTVSLGGAARCGIASQNEAFGIVSWAQGLTCKTKEWERRSTTERLAVWLYARLSLRLYLSHMKATGCVDDNWINLYRIPYCVYSVYR